MDTQFTPQQVTILMDLFKEHLIPYPNGADSSLWNERLGYLLDDIVALGKDKPVKE